MLRMLATLATTVLILAGCAGIPAQPLSDQDGQTVPFAGVLPEGFVVVARPRGPDFTVYDITKGGTGYVGVYVGNYASFPLRRDIEGTTTGGNPQVFGVERDGGLRPMEYLWTDEESYGQVHVWVQSSLAGAEETTARQVAQSIRPAGR